MADSQPPSDENPSVQHSRPVSGGVQTVDKCSDFNPSDVAESVAGDLTAAMVDYLVAPLGRVPEGSETGATAHQEIAALRANNEQLRAELGSARSELEFAALKEGELEERHRLAQQTISQLQTKIDDMVTQAQKSDQQVKDLRNQLASYEGNQTDTHGNLAQCQQALSASQSQLDTMREELDRSRQDDTLAVENSRLLQKISSMESELVDAKKSLSERQAIISTTEPTLELAEGGEENKLLAAAYQQISVLNTQLAHLYTELTMARTEVQRLKSDKAGDRVEAPTTNVTDSSAELHKQSAQIADLVSDIRHLQLDLEYHQQKLDQMIEEKQQMMKDLKKAQKDLTEARQQVEDRDQMLRHRDVDLQHLQQELKQYELKSPRDASVSLSGSKFGDDDGPLSALRAEAAAKDSALIVSHYELHKEKLLRDRLEQKNLKLMERMQKLMMVVETMRKENMTLERSILAKEKVVEEKDVQLRSMTTKARQLQKMVKGNRINMKSPIDKKGNPIFELASAQGLPPLDRNSIHSGASTPRTPRTPR